MTKRKRGRESPKKRKKKPKGVTHVHTLDDIRECATGKSPPSPGEMRTPTPSNVLEIPSDTDLSPETLDLSKEAAEEMISMIDNAQRKYKTAARKMANHLDVEEKNLGTPEKDAPPVSSLLLEAQSRFEMAVTTQVSTLIGEIETKDREIAKLKESASVDKQMIAQQKSELEAGFELAVKCQVDTLLVEIELKNKEITKLKECAGKDQARITRQKSEIESLLKRQRNEPETQATAATETPIMFEPTISVEAEENPTHGTSWSDVVCRKAKKQENSHRRETISTQSPENSSHSSDTTHRREGIHATSESAMESEMSSISEAYNFKPEPRKSMRYPNKRGTKPHGPYGYDILFNGSDDEFSNLYPCKLPFMGETFKSVEHAYQATSATENGFPEHYETIKNADTAMNAMQLAKELIFEKTELWENITKYEVMWQLEKLKYKHCREYRERLMSTGSRRLVERTVHKDWGGLYNKYIKGNGENHLGRMHMQIRDERLFEPPEHQSSSGTKPHTGEKPYQCNEQLLIIGTSHVRDLSTKQAGLPSQTLTYSGANIPYIRSRIKHILKDRNPPLIFLQAGGIDCDIKNINPSDISIEYSNLISEVKDMCPDSLLMIGQIPIRQTYNRSQITTNKNIMRVNYFLKHRGLRGDGVISINICPAPAPKVMRPDGVHFNWRGKEDMQDRLLQSVSHFIRK